MLSQLRSQLRSYWRNQLDRSLLELSQLHSQLRSNQLERSQVCSCLRNLIYR